jgi:hypothetical protein
MAKHLEPATEQHGHEQEPTPADREAGNDVGEPVHAQ